MKKKTRKAVKKYVILTLIGIVLFAVASKKAYQWRGYRSVGGEGAFLFIPVLYALMNESVKDFIGDIKEFVGEKKKGISRSGETLR